jgi:hypothetical protein
MVMTASTFQVTSYPEIRMLNEHDRSHDSAVRFVTFIPSEPECYNESVAKWKTTVLVLTTRTVVHKWTEKKTIQMITELHIIIFIQPIIDCAFVYIRPAGLSIKWVGYAVNVWLKMWILGLTENVDPWAGNHVAHFHTHSWHKSRWNHPRPIKSWHTNEANDNSIVFFSPSVFLGQIFIFDSFSLTCLFWNVSMFAVHH